MQHETWKVIDGYGGKYEVSDQGRVRSLMFVNGTTFKPRRVPLVMRLNWNNKGYALISLQSDGIEYKVQVSRLVLSAFVGPCPVGMETAHLDGNPKNNSLANLIWTSHTENMSHREIHGTVPRGDSHCRRKLSSVDVQRMRVLRSSGTPVIEIASQFGVTWGTVYSILRGDTWQSV